MKKVIRLQFRKGSRAEAPLQRRPSQETIFGTFFLAVVPNGMKPRVRGELTAPDGGLAWHGEDRDSAREATKDCQARYETMLFRQDTMRTAPEDEQAPAAPEEKKAEDSLPFPPLADEEAQIGNGSESPEPQVDMEVKPLLLDHRIDDPDLECLNKILVIVNTTSTMTPEIRVVPILDSVAELLKSKGFNRSAEAIGSFVEMLIEQNESSAKAQKAISRRGPDLFSRVSAEYRHEHSWRPSHVFKPMLMLDTDENGKPCFRATYQAFGVNGYTPEGTMLNFDRDWFTSGPNQKN